jgi:hypothetical protein
LWGPAAQGLGPEPHETNPYCPFPLLQSRSKIRRAPLRCSGGSFPSWRPQHSGRAVAQVQVTLRLTVSQSVCLGVGPMTRFHFLLSFAGQLLYFSSWDALSDERTGLQCVVQSVGGQSRGGLVIMHYCLIWAPFPSPLPTRRQRVLHCFGCYDVHAQNPLHFTGRGVSVLLFHNSITRIVHYDIAWKICRSVRLIIIRFSLCHKVQNCNKLLHHLQGMLRLMPAAVCKVTRTGKGAYLKTAITCSHKAVISDNLLFHFLKKIYLCIYLLGIFSTVRICNLQKCEWWNKSCEL